MDLTAENVRTVFDDCLFKDEEVVNGKPVIEPIKAEGIMATFGFHPARLESHKQEVKEMLSQLPDPFMKSKGGGWTFLNACMTKNGTQWGEHNTMEQLFVLGIALKICSFALPRKMWDILPGGMPYIVVED
jgi:hypothetical protein